MKALGLIAVFAVALVAAGPLLVGAICVAPVAVVLVLLYVGLDGAPRRI